MPADRATNVVHAIYVDEAYRDFGLTRYGAEQTLGRAVGRGDTFDTFGDEPIDEASWGLSEEAIAEQDRLLGFGGR